MATPDNKSPGYGGAGNGRQTVCCNRYGSTDFSRYLNGTMSKDELVLFEEHSAQCNACREGVRLEHTRILAACDARHNERFFQKAMQQLDAMATAAPVNLIDVVIGFFKQGLAVIRTTAEQITPQPAEAYRGSATDAQAPHPLRLVQEFNLPPLSVQIDYDGEITGKEVRFTISVFNRERDEFLTDYEAILVGPGIEQRASCDSSGKAILSVLPSGSCDIGLVRGNEHLASISILFNREAEH